MVTEKNNMHDRVFCEGGFSNTSNINDGQLICGRIIADCDHFIEKMFGRVIHFQIAVLDFLHYGSHHIKFDQACGLLGTFVDAYHISGGQVFQINRPLGRIAVDASGKLCFQLFPGKILIQRIKSVGRCKSGFCRICEKVSELSAIRKEAVLLEDLLSSGISVSASVSASV